MDSNKKNVKKILNVLGSDLFDKLLLLRIADLSAQTPREDNSTSEVRILKSEILANNEAVNLKDLMVRGDDIMETFKLSPSPIVGEILNFLLEFILDNPLENNKKMLLIKAEEYLENKKRS